MPTPLERYLQNRDPKLLRLCCAIGADNAHSTLLRDGLTGGRRQGLPQTLASHLKSTGKAWSTARNNAWIREMTRTVQTVYIYHDKICEGIHAYNDAGSLDANKFDNKFKGSKNSSYQEIVAFLNAGFTTIEYSGGNGTKGAVLTK